MKESYSAEQVYNVLDNCNKMIKSVDIMRKSNGKWDTWEDVNTKQISFQSSSDDSCLYVFEEKREENGYLPGMEDNATLDLGNAILSYDKKNSQVDIAVTDNNGGNLYLFSYDMKNIMSEVERRERQAYLKWLKEEYKIEG